MLLPHIGPVGLEFLTQFSGAGPDTLTLLASTPGDSVAQATL